MFGKTCFCKRLVQLNSLFEEYLGIHWLTDDEGWPSFSLSTANSSFIILSSSLNSKIRNENELI